MKFLHCGFLVKDVEKVAATYKELFDVDVEPIKEYALPLTFEGKVYDTKSKVTHFHTSDGTEVEIVQRIMGPCVDELALGDREGISHLAFQVDDLEKERARMIKHGIKIVNEGSAPRAKWFFVHDERLGGAIVQLVQMN